jgi:hypothetical protein
MLIGVKWRRARPVFAKKDISCIAQDALVEEVVAQRKGPEVESLKASGVREGYLDAGTTRAALAVLAAFFFSSLTLAQRFC